MVPVLLVLLVSRVIRMRKKLDIDVDFDYRSDTPPGKDPDRASPRLKHDHQLLWGRQLPSGSQFDLSASEPGTYLYHKSQLGEFFLSSDAIIPTFDYWERLAPIMEHVPESEIEEFSRITYTIGGMIIFPSNPIGGGHTINQSRGTNRSIEDRFDLTLECIRRHYLGEASPLADTLSRYSDFFDLFVDFHGYVEFFFLRDLVADDGAIRWFMPFAEFAKPAFPQTLEAYKEYRRLSVEFVEARNRRIAAFCEGAE